MNKGLFNGQQKAHYKTLEDFVLVFLYLTLFKYLPIGMHNILTFLWDFYDSDRVWWAQKYWQILHKFLVRFLYENEFIACDCKTWLENLVNHSISINITDPDLEKTSGKHLSFWLNTFCNVKKQNKSENLICNFSGG